MHPTKYTQKFSKSITAISTDVLTTGGGSVATPLDLSVLLNV